MSRYSVVGRRVPPVDGKVKVTGEAQFTVDIQLPRMLCGRILRSPYPHARILHIDAQKALNLPGVRAVLTGADMPEIKFGVFSHLPATHDLYGLAKEKVRYVGEEVVAVAAVDEWTAEEALELISIDYEVLPAVFDPIEAMKPGAPLVHEDAERNISRAPHFEFGKVEQAFSEAYYVREDSFATQPVTHCALETHATIAQWDQAGRITIWSSTQSPFKICEALAYVLGLPLNKIRVVKPFVGGGFGGKADGLFPMDLCAVMLAKKTGRPVKIVNNREEEFTASRRRHPYVITLKTGVAKDGTLLAVDAKAISDAGAYNSWGPAIIGRAGVQLMMQYRIPNVRYEGYRVYTNKAVSGAMRGWGNLQMRFAADSQLDMIAEEIGVDPADIRLRNCHESGDMMPNKAWIPSCALAECIEQVSGEAGWRNRRARKTKNRGMGMGCWAYVSAAKQLAHDSTAAIIKVFEDGTATLITGASDIGQGSNTTMAQIAAEELGVELDDITIVSGDTDITPLDLGTFSSRVTFISGNAVKAAAEDVKKQLFPFAAERLGVSPSDLVSRGRRIYVKDNPELSMAFGEAVKGCLYSVKGQHIVGTGNFNPDTVVVDQVTYEGHSGAAYAYGVEIVEVEVDRETGEVHILSRYGAHDSGTAINPMQAEGQLQGASFGGLAQALYEDLATDEGQVMNPSFLDYKLPTALDVPAYEPTLIQSPDPGGPFGAKGMSEGCQIATSPAIANAVYDAVGVRILDLPITPEKVLKGLREQEVASSTKAIKGGAK